MTRLATFWLRLLTCSSLISWCARTSIGSKVSRIPSEGSVKTSSPATLRWPGNGTVPSTVWRLSPRQPCVVHLLNAVGKLLPPLQTPAHP
ncbi:hypothetical protein PF008_g26023 [Phytophthora fragariae]|uniref:RxLR effector protein n=1 Tax=Phytophthora fragariae TaxID=53985 RepID=A0A6G0QIA3_9STRA|nr:hypothetical protein PF008_g26023 [Phytophthora fragariae]